MLIQYLRLSAITLLPVLVSLLFHILNKKTSFSKIKESNKQIVYGLAFGLLAVLGTEAGVPLNGAQINCRDGAVLAAGLLFGAPAGIIAGLIGGIERWIAVAWGIGTYTRVACSVSTAIAGLYSAVLRKYMFDNKRPGWLISFAIGIVMETFHLTMIFITNMSEPIRAMEVVKNCTLPMMLVNGLGIMFASMAVSFAAKDKLFAKSNNVRISQTIQKWLLITVLLAFLVTSSFVLSLQDEMAKSQTRTLLDLSVSEISKDVKDASDKHILEIARQVKDDLEDSKNLESIKKKYGLAEINLVNSEGIIYESTNKEYIGFSMRSGSQSMAFMVLLKDEEEIVQDFGPTSYYRKTERKYAGVKYKDGFIQIGFDALGFQREIDSQMKGITKNRHVGETGYIMILNNNLEITSAPEQFNNLADEEAEEWRYNFAPDENKIGKAVIFGEPCYLKFITTEGYYVVSVLPEKEAMQTRNTAVFVNTFMEILVFAVLFALIYMLIKKVVVDQIKKINSSLGKITRGNLNEVVNVRTNEEFSSLSDDINSTVNTLKQYISEAEDRINQELEFAKTIQSSALPTNFPQKKEFDIFASMNPAKEVGGDFYDFYQTNDDKLHFLVADVSGKGIPAAMFMMRAKTELKTLTEAGLPLNEVFTKGNNALCEGNLAGMFVTAWQGQLDLSNGKVIFANAGHNPPLVKRNGKFEYLKSRAGLVLAGMEDLIYKAQEFELQEGDIIFVYTDGVTEATNNNNELFGEDRLLETVNSREFATMKEMCSFVKQTVADFTGTAPQFDDITMLAVKFMGRKKTPCISFEKAGLADIPTITDFAEEELNKIGVPAKSIIQINIAIDEIYSNIVNHGYAGTSGPAKVEIIEKDSPHSVFIKFTDEGIPYNPLTKEDPDITLSAEDRTIGGLGIFMVKKTMDDMRYKYENGCNILTIEKRLDK